MSNHEDALPIAKGEHVIPLLPRMANRHGLITARPAPGTR